MTVNGLYLHWTVVNGTDWNQSDNIYEDRYDRPDRYKKIGGVIIGVTCCTDIQHIMPFGVCGWFCYVTAQLEVYLTRMLFGRKQLID